MQPPSYSVSEFELKMKMKQADSPNHVTEKSLNPDLSYSLAHAGRILPFLLSCFLVEVF